MAVQSIRFHIPEGTSTKIIEQTTSNLQFLGEGSFGKVYRKIMPKIPGSSALSSDVAVKVGVIDEIFIRQRMEEEIRILHKVKGTPNIVTIIGSCDTQDTITITTEYIRGQNLSEGIIKRAAYSSIFTILSITSQIASALDALGNMGIIHGDLYENNVMYDGRTITLIDFGVATDLDITCSTDHIMYPVSRRPPEVILGVPVTTNSPDVYALAMLIYAVFTKHLLIQADKDETFSVYSSILFAMSSLHGQPPLELLSEGRLSKLFFVPCTHQFKTTPSPTLATLHPRKLDLITDVTADCVFENPARGAFLKNLLVKMLCWIPKDRPTPKEIIKEIELFDINS